MNTWVGVAVPAGHVVFVSMNFLDVSCEDSVSLYKGGNSTSGGTIVWQKCHVFLPRPVLLDTSEFHVHFRSSKYTVRGKGFRLLFTFHKRSEALRELERGKWNCSVTHWADFKQHFPCNLRQDCVNGEDEAECPYSQKCGLGRVWTINRCYIYVIPDKQPLTWGEAATLCLLQDKNAQLASLTTYREMRDVRRALANRTMDRVFVGLTSASAWDMPLM
ncbi:hypothetical protein BaRGS_00032787 [Batillaria attramentaria]|uniref:C-type lectin domain-containing protein n=1 Tax=Batillaria attramentaria TaxID=370345 RepID=A0ABD0JMH1_9CAEN